jgi:hypothetical protein
MLNISSSSDFDRNGILVSFYKLFITEDDLVYFAFDPVDEEKHIDEDDNNFIFAKNISIQILDDDPVITT